MDGVRRLSRRSLAAGLATLVVIAAGGGSGGPTASASAPPASVAGLPDDWVQLVDDSALLTVPVPPEWDDVDTAAQPSDGDQTSVPTIAASTDLGAMESSLEVPGLRYAAVAFDPDVRSALERYGRDADCATTTTERYDDGAFAGLIRHGTECALGADQDGTAEVFDLVASPADQSLSVTLSIQIPSTDDRDIVEVILDWFNLTPRPAPVASVVESTEPPPVTTTTTEPPATTSTSSTTTTSTTSTTTTTTTSTTSSTSSTTTTTTTSTTQPPAPPTTSTVPVPIPPTTPPSPTTTSVSNGLALVNLVDDTGALLISVPAAWNDVDTTPFRQNGVDVPYIEVSTDRSLFLVDEADETYSVPGVLYRATSYVADTAAELATFVNEGCADSGTAQYSDGVFTGHLHSYTSCGGTSTRQYLLIASPADRSFTALLAVQLVEPGDAEWHAILGSFNYNPAVMATLPFGVNAASNPASVVTTTASPL